MATFKEFIKSIQDDGNDGKAFEHFCKWFLINDPYWKTQVDKAWLWNEWPERWGPDCGIDLIFKHKNGETWAVQAKCYDEKYSVSKDDMNAFLTESNRAVIQHRLLLASTNGMSSNGERACAGQEKPVTLYMLKDFENAQVEYPFHISGLASAAPKAKPIPDPHQVRAIKDVVSKFEGHERGQLIMACGTGKTFTTLWIKEALAAQTTLVLVPSLNLLSQTLNEWAFAAKDSFAVLCVCSDKTVGKRDKEDMALGEAAFAVTSELSVISDFISNDGHKVIFCTYQSSALIAEMQSDKSVDPFDLVIADEAHRCSGKSDAAFSKVLDGEAIRATKRLFTTATPRLYSSSVKKAAADRGIEVYGMDHKAVFGPVLHTLTFGQAIAEDLLNDYQVVIVGVDQPMVKEWIENQELLGVNPNNVTDARTLAAKIGLLKAIKDYGLTRVISFHSRVNAARDFAAEVSELVDLIEPSNRPKGTLWSSFVSGAMRTTDRIIEIGRLKSLESADIGVLSNAKCLSEGVDVPSLDGVAFIDPKSSQVDIIQAVGRAIRKIRGASTQTKGTIVLPVFVEEGDDAEAQIEASKFKPVWDVLKALRSHDEALAENLDQYRTNMAKKSRTTRQTLDDKIIFDMPTNVDPSFSSALRTVLVEATTASWEFWFGLLEEYIDEKGVALIPAKGKYRDLNLGVWVDSQRNKKYILNSEKIKRLNGIGFIWDVLEHQWNHGLLMLEIFYKREGHSRVPLSYKEADFKLGVWVNTQRSNRLSLSSEKILRLNDLEFVWDAYEDDWKLGLSKLKKFKNRTGHCLVPHRFKEDGFKLGNWVGNKRRDLKKNILSEMKIESLNALGFYWNPNQEQWIKGFEKLQQFFTREQHCLVKRGHFEGKFNLASWVSNQRSRKDNLTLEQINKLEELGFVWDGHETAWENGLGKLKQFYEREGHCLVVRGHKEDNYKLDIWVTTQRSKKDNLSSERIKRLDALGFSWDPLTEQWEEGLNKLKQFYKREGNCLVPAKHIEDGYKLGLWVSGQRSKKDNLSSERIKRLDALGFVWKRR